MIKTLEQYDEIMLEAEFANDGELSALRKGHLEETIEALRRFVRAQDAVELGVIDFDLQNEQVQELKDSRAALPDWIKEK